MDESHRVPTYIAELLRLLRPEDLRPGDLIHNVVFHDDWCAHWRGGACDCSPEVYLLSESPRSRS